MVTERRYLEATHGSEEGGSWKRTRNSQEILTVVFIDLNFLKQYNDASLEHTWFLDSTNELIGYGENSTAPLFLKGEGFDQSRSWKVFYCNYLNLICVDRPRLSAVTSSSNEIQRAIRRAASQQPNTGHDRSKAGGNKNCFRTANPAAGA